MNNPQLIMDHMEYYLADPGRGVLGLDDDFMAAARQQDIRLGWQDGCFSVIFLEGTSLRRIEVPLRKSVARAALARIAALCNERSPASVSPYGGQGEVAIDADTSKVIRATFVNTPETQSLELASVSSEVVSLVSLSEAKSSQ